MKLQIVRLVVASALLIAPAAALANTTKLPHDHTPVVHSHTPTVHVRTDTAHH